MTTYKRSLHCILKWKGLLDFQFEVVSVAPKFLSFICRLSFCQQLSQRIIFNEIFWMKNKDNEHRENEL